MIKNFYSQDLPFGLKPGSVLKNMYKYWQIEHPQTRQLLNKITIDIEPGDSQSIVVVLKTPVCTKPLDMLSSLKITCIGISFIQKQLETGRRRLQEQSKEVLLCGRLENPVVLCQKALINLDLKQSYIPLAVRKNMPIQKFRLPFTTKLDVEDDKEFEFIFIKTVLTEENEDMFKVFECMVFFCQPSVLKLCSSQPAILNVQLKVDVEKLNELPLRVLKRPLTKLLIARVKGTTLLQSFYVNLHLIEGESQD